MPVIDVRSNQPVSVERKFAPARNMNAWLPGERCIPTQRPVSANRVARLLDLVQIHFAVTKPGFDKGDRRLVAIDPPKLTRRVFKVHILCVDAIGLIVWKALIVGFENLDDSHSVNL